MANIAKLTETATHCAYCGHPLPSEGDLPERFGERFCSEAHAEGFAAGVRVARIAKAAQIDEGVRKVAGRSGGCAPPAQGQGSWRNALKRAVCWGAPLLVLLAVPLFWSGGWAATGGSLLTVLAFLACPVGMYFMMRGMMGMHQDGRSAAEHPKEDHRA